MHERKRNNAFRKKGFSRPFSTLPKAEKAWIESLPFLLESSRGGRKCRKREKVYDDFFAERCLIEELRAHPKMAGMFGYKKPLEKPPSYGELAKSIPDDGPLSCKQCRKGCSVTELRNVLERNGIVARSINAEHAKHRRRRVVVAFQRRVAFRKAFTPPLPQ